MKKHLLIVDDEDSILDLLKEVFEGLVDQVYTTTNGEEAFAMVKENGEINCILSDIKMPVCDGFGLLKKLKDSKVDIPLVFLTGFADSENVARAKLMGVSEIVEKNEWDRVIDVVNSVYTKNGESLY